MTLVIMGVSVGAEHIGTLRSHCTFHDLYRFCALPRGRASIFWNNLSGAVIRRNNNLHSLAFTRFVATGRVETWTLVCHACREFKGFDDPRRVYIVYLEKRIHSAFADVFIHVPIFLDKLYVAENMFPSLGNEKVRAHKLYKKVSWAPSKPAVDAAKAQDGQKTSVYLSKFIKE